jgi:phytol kinase
MSTNSMIRIETASDSYNETVRIEILRKSIHMMVAFVPAFAKINIGITLALLASAVFAYTFAEYLRINGRKVFIISGITEAASRSGTNEYFVLGPVTLAIGAMLSLMLYPAQAAAIAIYALAFGDGFSSLFGKIYGRVAIPFTGGKTFAGSLACLVSVFFVALSVTGSLRSAAVIAMSATLLEALPAGDLDNIIVPVGTGFVAWVLVAGI